MIAMVDVLTHEVLDKRLALYRDYIRSLAPFGCTVDTPFKMYEQAFEQMRLPYVWHDIYANEGKLPMGFLVLGYGDACHPDCDVWIAQSYLSPDSRGRGLMANAVAGALADADARRVVLDVLIGNPAKGYWERLFHHLGWKRTVLPASAVGDPVELLFFERGWDGRH